MLIPSLICFAIIGAAVALFRCSRTWVEMGAVWAVLLLALSCVVNTAAQTQGMLDELPTLDAAKKLNDQKTPFAIWTDQKTGCKYLASRTHYNNWVIGGVRVRDDGVPDCPYAPRKN